MLLLAFSLVKKNLIFIQFLIVFQVMPENLPFLSVDNPYLESSSCVRSILQTIPFLLEIPPVKFLTTIMSEKLFLAYFWLKKRLFFLLISNRFSIHTENPPSVENFCWKLSPPNF